MAHGADDALPDQHVVASSLCARYALAVLKEHELFGEYVRRHSQAAKLSLRAVAKLAQLSFTYLGEVERGKCGPLDPSLWLRLMMAIPGMTFLELSEAHARSHVLRIDMLPLGPLGRSAARELADLASAGRLDEEFAAQVLDLLRSRR